MDELEVVNLHKNYEGAPLLRGIHLKVNSGETLCLLGRSGSGKSTLLRIIAGLEIADSGEIRWNKQNMGEVPTYRRNFGLMFQDYALFPHMTVWQNVAFGLRMQGKSKVELSNAVKEALALVNMGGFAERGVTDLSGGEQQRIALARALAAKPRLLMLDEPLAALDRALRMELQEELRRLLHQTGIPAIYVTHDQEEALVLGDQVAILADGVIEQEGKPEEVYRNPKNRKVAEFLGMTNFLEGKVVSTKPLEIETELGRFSKTVGHDSKLHIGEPVTLLLRTRGAVRSEKKNAVNSITGKVVDCLFRGEEYKVILEVTGSKLMVFSLPEPATLNSTLRLEFQDSCMVSLEK